MEFASGVGWYSWLQQNCYTHQKSISLGGSFLTQLLVQQRGVDTHKHTHTEQNGPKIVIKVYSQSDLLGRKTNLYTTV